MRRSIVLLATLVCLPSCSDALDRLRARKDAGAARVTTDDDPPPPGPAPTAPVKPTSTPAVPKTPAPGPAPAPVATDAASLEKSFAALDFNPDGNLDGIELQRCNCASADRDGNGEVSKAEYMAAGLLGKLPPPNPNAGPAPAPAPRAPANPNAPPAPAPAPAPAAGGGLPLGKYSCYSLVGNSYGFRGAFVILDGSRYQMPDGSGAGTYTFDRGTKKIRWTSGVYADPNAVKDAWQVSAKQISMKTGKDGFYQYDCTLGG